MKKNNSFFEMLLSQSETICKTEGKKVLYFNERGNPEENEENAKWWVSDGVVYDNGEKVSSKQAKYSHNLGFLY